VTVDGTVVARYSLIEKIRNFIHVKNIVIYSSKHFLGVFLPLLQRKNEATRKYSYWIYYAQSHDDLKKDNAALFYNLRTCRAMTTRTKMVAMVEACSSFSLYFMSALAGGNTRYTRAPAVWKKLFISPLLKRNC
jgi:hypothetical protein